MHAGARARSVAALVSAAAAIALGSAASGEELHPGIIGTDDRVRVEAHGAPWDAIGQVNIGGYRRSVRCTGTLVAPDLLLTAAHCVMDPIRKAPFRLSDIHFLAGVRGSDRVAHAVAKCLRFADGGDDAVAILLTDKLSVAAAPVATGVVPVDGLPLVHAAYPGDRRYALSADFHCHLRGVGDPGLWLTDCDTHPGSSGGPLFVTVDGELRLAAIMIATQDRKLNVALPEASWGNLVHASTCP